MFDCYLRLILQSVCREIFLQWSYLYASRINTWPPVMRNLIKMLYFHKINTQSGPPGIKGIFKKTLISSSNTTTLFFFFVVSEALAVSKNHSILSVTRNDFRYSQKYRCLRFLRKNFCYPFYLARKFQRLLFIYCFYHYLGR